VLFATLTPLEHSHTSPTDIAVDSLSGTTPGSAVIPAIVSEVLYPLYSLGHDRLPSVIC
jgi:hypothetical protein